MSEVCAPLSIYYLDLILIIPFSKRSYEVTLIQLGLPDGVPPQRGGHVRGLVGLLQHHLPRPRPPPAPRGGTLQEGRPAVIEFLNSDILTTWF